MRMLGTVHLLRLALGVASAFRSPSAYWIPARKCWSSGAFQKNVRIVSHAGSEDAALFLGADPGQREILVLLADRQKPARRLGLLHIDAEKHVHALAQRGFLQLHDFIVDLESFALNAALSGLFGSSTFMV